MQSSMVSFIIVAKEKKKREAYCKKFAEKHAINAFDITVIEKDETKMQSIGIETIKQIHKKIFFKPIKSKDKLVIIEDAQLLTPEAQNALLKVLEEPPAHTFILLTTESQEALLPTILSRCQIIILEEEKKKMSEKTIEELNDFIQILPELSIGERLKQAEILAKDKEKAIKWIENVILILREELLKNYSLSEGVKATESKSSNQTNSLQARTIKSFQKLHTLLKTTNVNPRFAIENTLLNI
jgi:DNA polymerase III delta prime subunit